MQIPRITTFSPKKVLPQKALKDFANLEIKPKSRILLISPHPDDETLSSFQLLSQAISLGCSIKLILLTDGNKRGLKARRRVEFERVIKAMGISLKDVTYLDHKDGELNRLGEVVENQLQATISHYRPNYIVSPHPKDIHKDHKFIGKMLYKIWEESSDQETDSSYNFTLLQYLIHYPPTYPWPRKLSPKSALLPPVNLLYFNDDNQWRTIKLKPKEVERKLNTLEIYQSQLKTPILRGLMYSLIRKNELFQYFPASEIENAENPS